MCDLRIADETACFALPAARLGLSYPSYAVRRLVEATGPAVAREMLYTARRYTADEALRAGLVTSTGGEPALRESAAAIAANAPLSVRAAKLAIERAAAPADVTHDGGTELAELEDACWASQDFREGQAAFRERRAPEFRGV
ncbi:enoyl-CoA hydratase-related protein [Streptomyces sp. NPDC088387]|uniref:enoyl-CoA hydratase-related protein n=1 Tax=Streptomyces sp. NPDC088387 TaxID=3365859 RepID=UPI003801B46B